MATTDTRVSIYPFFGSMLQAFLESRMVELTQLQLHGPEEELAKLREPLAGLNPEYWVLECGFRR